jgi:hypothetical protein
MSCFHGNSGRAIIFLLFPFIVPELRAAHLYALIGFVCLIVAYALASYHNHYGGGIGVAIAGAFCFFVAMAAFYEA